MNSTSPSLDVGRFRKLRVAWSVIWGGAAVLLIVLWLRSYWWISHVSGPITSSRYVQSHSFGGWVWIGHPTYRTGHHPWSHTEEPSYAWKQPMMFVTPADGTAIPYWLLAIVLSSTAAAPWIR